MRFFCFSAFLYLTFIGDSHHHCVGHQLVGFHLEISDEQLESRVYLSGKANDWRNRERVVLDRFSKHENG